MSAVKLKIGQKGAQLVHINDVVRGLACECVCPHCGAKLEAKKGLKRAHHFAHAHDKKGPCEYGVESSLHLFAKELIERKGEIVLPPITEIVSKLMVELAPEKKIVADRVIIEKKEGDIKPDLIVYSAEKKYFVEITVTHPITAEKKEKIKERGVSTVEINLQKFYGTDFESEDLENIIIADYEHKDWVYNADKEQLLSSYKEKLLENKKLDTAPRWNSDHPPTTAEINNKDELKSSSDHGRRGKVDFENELNKEQYAAVSAPDGPSLVIAAAGTGKTRTLVYRVAWLIEKGVDPNRILLLTFTNKAAREMLDRAHALTGGAVSGLLGGTFHHLANRLLRQHAREIGFGNDYTILDSDDAKKLMKSCIDELEIDDKHFPKPQVLLSLYGLASGSQKPLDDLAYDWFDDAPIDIGDVLKLRDHYTKRKKELNVMDFDDLLLYALKLFQTSEYVRNLYQERFQYVLVDEYQDTNTIQAEWVHLLAGKHKNLMVVGDDFQSIYSWRGADYHNFLSFPKRYPDAQTYKLETNYRSTPEILNVANACIKGNPMQFQKTLHAVRDSMAEPTLALLRDGDEQARYVISKIEELKRKGTKLSDIAVLYRSHFHAMELQMALTHARFPYQVTSGIRFFEQAHVKDACTVLRLLENPSDELAFKRLLEMFPKLGPKTADKIWKKLGSRFEARTPEAHAKLLNALPAACESIWREIQPVFLAYDKETLSEDPGEIIFRFNKAFYGEYLVETFDNAKHRQEDLDNLIDFTSRFESCADFLSEMALLSNLDSEAETAPAGQDGVRLSTVHQAKGLEWKAVFVIWLNEGLFPSAKSVEQIGGEAEERRLFYVATTRAEDRLFLCAPQVRRKHDGGVIFYEPSPFIREIPDHLLKKDGGFF